MLSSRRPRSPSPGKSSKRFCGSSRSHGRSHHQRYRETFDVMHSRATDRRNASKCQGKCPDQTLDQAFGLSEVLVAVSASRLSCKRAGKTRTLMPVWDSSGESRDINQGEGLYVRAEGAPTPPVLGGIAEGVADPRLVKTRERLPKNDTEITDMASRTQERRAFSDGRGWYY
jgi:hypothetical protein